MNNHATIPLSVGHSAYVEQVKQLVDEHMERLEALLRHSAACTDPTGRQTVGLRVARGARWLRLSAGDNALLFDVEVSIDVPEGASRALFFPTGPARCLVHASDSILARWDLRRLYQESTSPTYAWMVAQTETRVGPAEMATVVAHVLACRAAEDPVVASIPA